MTASSFLPGQRWVSNTESELGLGLVTKVAHRRVELVFPAAGEQRLYAVDNAPLSRVQYQAGEHISSEDGRSLAIEAVMEANGCLIYRAIDEHGETVVLPEQDLNSHVQFSKPQDRLFAGQIDANRAFELRCETLEHNRRQQQSAVRGLVGPRVQLLPHQLYIAQEVSSRYAPRVLLADEVGLGKTIEAGLILHQQLISGRVQRVLIVVPDSLLHQWLVEMLRRFNLLFSIIDEERCADPEKGLEGSQQNLFEASQLVLCTLSFLCQNPTQHALAMAAEWDLLIVDEAHHLLWTEAAPSAEYQCIEALAKQARGLLLLTATPEQLGVASHFARLRLLDPDRYFSLQAFVEEERKHQPVNRLVQDLTAPDVRERLLLPEVKEQLGSYLGESTVAALLGLANTGVEAVAGDDFAVAVRAVMRDLLDRHGTGRVLFRNTRATVGGFPDRQLLQYPLTAPDEYVYGSQDASAEQLLTPEQLRGEAWMAHDPRVLWLARWLEQHRGEKALVICARATTALALEEYLRLRSGTLSAVFHEGLSLVERDRAAAYFSSEPTGAQVLVCSEIGSEGRNFQFAHHLVLFDLPLNPDLLEQRIGRLDRIGQHHTVQIHVPYFANSAQHVLLSWYHEGLNAFEHICPAGQALYQRFAPDLQRCMHDAGNEAALRELLDHTRESAAASILALQQGRDRLLELNSFNSEEADRIMVELDRADRSQALSAWLEQLLDLFGVEQEHHSSNTLVLRPGAHMLVASFPALPEDGATVTCRRDLALSREDIQYLTWEHPLVTGAMDLVLNGEFGNSAVCTLKLPPLKPGTILLESIFSLACVAPGNLQLSRYLPPTTVRLLLDNAHNDLGAILGSEHLKRLAQEAPLHSARELVRHTRPQLSSMLAQAKVLAEARAAQLRQEATTSMRTEQKIELQRLRALAVVNPNIRTEEIQFLQEAEARLGGFIQNAQLRLDAVRVAIVTE